jgi:hypothetical protein
MPQYTFEALDPGGKQITGTVDASNRREAYHEIECRQLSPIHVVEKRVDPKSSAGKEGSTPAQAAASDTTLRRFRVSIAPGSSSSRANLPTSSRRAPGATGAQRHGGESAGSSDPPHWCARSTPSSRGGNSRLPLSVRRRQVFDDLYISLISAGEASGTLPGVLHRMAHSMTQIHDLQRRFIQALVYPAFMIVACVLLMAVFVLVLVPQLTGLLAKSGQQLPAITLPAASVQRVLHQILLDHAPWRRGHLSFSFACSSRPPRVASGGIA